MNRDKITKLLIPVGTLCLSIALAMKALTSGVHTDAFQFISGMGIGLGATLILGGTIKLKAANRN